MLVLVQHCFGFFFLSCELMTVIFLSGVVKKGGGGEIVVDSSFRDYRYLNPSPVIENFLICGILFHKCLLTKVGHFDLS